MPNAILIEFNYVELYLVVRMLMIYKDLFHNGPIISEQRISSRSAITLSMETGLVLSDDNIVFQ